MEQRTTQHIELARRNQALAQALLNPNTNIQPPPLAWAAVVAFYSAVHYVNAYPWEKARFYPSDHDERKNAVDTWTDLKAASSSFARLQQLGWHGRYTRTFTPPRSDIEEAINVDLVTVAGVTQSALNALTP